MINWSKFLALAAKEEKSFYFMERFVDKFGAMDGLFEEAIEINTNLIGYSYLLGTYKVTVRGNTYAHSDAFLVLDEHTDNWYISSGSIVFKSNITDRADLIRALRRLHCSPKAGIDQSAWI